MKLKKGQVIYIDNERYVIISMIEFRQNIWKWQEYEIISDKHIHKWLSVEENEKHKQLEYYLYEIYQAKEINKNYKLYEEGVATVIDYFGNTDVDCYETCEYRDYATQDEETIISIEKWEDETENTIGYYIAHERIKITEEIDEEYKKLYKNKADKTIKNKNTIGIVISSVILLGVIVLFFSQAFPNQSIQKYLEKETSKYTYVTSITSNVKNEKAKVYESTFKTIDVTVKDIIDGVPEGITQTTEAEPNIEEGSIGLQTNHEYAYIYKEDGKIYIQVSSKEYVRNSGNMYHTRHYHHYYNGFRSTRPSDIYSNYANSARQRSVNSRTLSGGGTSSGK
jgi:hypothetical protein